MNITKTQYNMTQEEKAKAYDEALERAKEDISSGILARRETARYIFPELRESSEEMVRRTIISTLYRDDYLSTEEVNECVSWLEKQGNDSYLQEKIENFTNAHKGEDPDGIIAACRGGEKQGEQVIDANKMMEQEWSEEDERIRKAIICYIGYGQHCGVSNIDMIAWLEKQNKQILANSAKTCKDEQKFSNLESIGEEWSEEDEENLYLTIAAIEKKYSGELFLDKKKVKEQEGTGRKLLDWLYSFQDRVKPQPKQDWSEEDERILEQIKFAVLNLSSYREDTRQECIDWLKLLKERFYEKKGYR